MTERTIRKKLKQIIAIKQQIEANKALYERLDALILDLTNAGAKLRTYRDMSFNITDNFAVTNVCFRPAAVRRYEINIRTFKKAKRPLGRRK